MIAVVKTDELMSIMYRKGWTRRKLAQVAQIGEVTAQQVVNGKRNPSPRVARKIVEALEVEFDDIFELVPAELIPEEVI